MWGWIIDGWSSGDLYDLGSGVTDLNKGTSGPLPTCYSRLTVVVGVLCMDVGREPQM